MNDVDFICWIKKKLSSLVCIMALANCNDFFFFCCFLFCFKTDQGQFLFPVFIISSVLVVLKTLEFGRDSGLCTMTNTSNNLSFDVVPIRVYHSVFKETLEEVCF